jgi:hypothetical protein
VWDVVCIVPCCCSSNLLLSLSLFLSSPSLPLSLSLCLSLRLHIRPSLSHLALLAHIRACFKALLAQSPSRPARTPSLLPLSAVPLRAHSRTSWPNPPDPCSGAGSSHTPSPKSLPNPTYIKKEVRPISRAPPTKYGTNHLQPLLQTAWPRQEHSAFWKLSFACG